MTLFLIRRKVFLLWTKLNKRKLWMTFTNNKVYPYHNHLYPGKQKLLPHPTPLMKQKASVKFYWETRVIDVLIKCQRPLTCLGGVLWVSIPRGYPTRPAKHPRDTPEGRSFLYVRVWAFHQNSARVSGTKPQSSKTTTTKKIKIK